MVNEYEIENGTELDRYRLLANFVSRVNGLELLILVLDFDHGAR